MKVKITEARKKLMDVLLTSGASKKDAETMADIMMEYDFHKNTFSGFSGVEYRRDQLRNSIGKSHVIVVDKPSMKLIDAGGRSALLEGMEAVRLVCDMAKRTGIAMVGIYNSTYHEGFDSKGNMTRDPNKAVAIVPFGEHKGYAINLMLEVVTGILVRAKSGLSVKDDAGGIYGNTGLHMARV